MDEPKKVTIFYRCDRKACGDVCPNPECLHTTKIEHAVNFYPCKNSTGMFLYYIECEK